MSKKDLYNQEAKDKIKELTEDIDFAMFATHIKNMPFHVIPMSTKKVDDNGDIWFLSGKDSDHNKNIQKEADIQLIYSNPSSMSFMVLHGKATITADQTILKELYGSGDDNWFEGLDDPNLTAIKVKPSEAHYWEPKSNKFVTLFKMGMGAITGDDPDIGEHGNLKS